MKIKQTISTIVTICSIGENITTTIQVNEEIKERLRSFGQKGEAYQDIINKLYNIAAKQQLREFLFSKKAIPIDEAIKRAKKK